MYLIRARWLTRNTRKINTSILWKEPQAHFYPLKLNFKHLLYQRFSLDCLDKKNDLKGKKRTMPLRHTRTKPGIKATLWLILLQCADKQHLVRRWIVAVCHLLVQPPLTPSLLSCTSQTLCFSCPYLHAPLLPILGFSLISLRKKKLLKKRCVYYKVILINKLINFNVQIANHFAVHLKQWLQNFDILNTILSSLYCFNWSRFVKLLVIKKQTSNDSIWNIHLDLEKKAVNLDIRQ